MKLKEHRFFAELTQYELYLKTGVHQHRISFIERGLAMPTKRERWALAYFFGKKPDEIQWGSGDLENETNISR